MPVKISDLYAHYKPLYQSKKAKGYEEEPPRPPLTQEQSDEQFRKKVGAEAPSYFIVDFSLRPADVMFEPNYRKKFTKVINWEAVEQRILERMKESIGNEVFSDIISAGIEGETSDGRVVCTIVVASPRSTMINRLRRLIPPKGEALLRVKDPVNQKFLPMVADEFCISFGAGGEWFYQDWLKLANSLPH